MILYPKFKSAARSVSIHLTTRCDGVNLRRRFSQMYVWLLVGVVALTVVGRAASSQQLSYDTTTFVHGFASDPSIWTTPYSDLQGRTAPNYLNLQINLRAVKFPNLDSAVRYNAQVGNLFAALRNGRHVLPAHSLGSMVARGTFIDSSQTRANIAAIIAIAPLHQGAPLADNFTRARGFFADLQRRIDDGLQAVRAVAEVLNFLLFQQVPDVYGLGPALISYFIERIPGQVLDFSSLNSFGDVEALPDLSPNSMAVQRLNSRTDDAVIPRANIYGTIPHKHAAMRVLHSALNDDAGFPAAVRRRNQGMTLFKGCRVVGYATILMGSGRSGRRCGFAARVLGRVDDRWVRYVNNTDPTSTIRLVPFDGIVPNERTVYPSPNGVTYESPIAGVNHLNIYKTRRGLDQVAEAMRRIGMELQGLLAITGPTVIESTVQEDHTWSASTSESGSWSFQWEISINGGSFSLVSNASTYTRTIFAGDEYNFTLRATATDAGRTLTNEVFVTVTPPPPGGCEPTPPALTC